MIKVGRYVYIHFTTIFLFAVCYFTRKLEYLGISYALVFLHELAHFTAAFFIGACPSRIVFYPFGVNLRLKNNIIFSISDEILLYLSGPLLNAILALFTLAFFRNNRYAEYFYLNNIALFLFNLIPIVPMDGAMILKSILTKKIGTKKTERITNSISCVMICGLLGIEGYALYKHSFNYSAVFMVIFLMANIFTNKEKYNTDFLKELLYMKNKEMKKISKAQVLLVNEESSYKELAESFVMCKRYIVFVQDKKGRVKKILTENDIINSLLK